MASPSPEIVHSTHVRNDQTDPLRQPVNDLCETVTNTDEYHHKCQVALTAILLDGIPAFFRDLETELCGAGDAILQNIDLKDCFIIRFDRVKYQIHTGYLRTISAPRMSQMKPIPLDFEGADDIIQFSGHANINDVRTHGIYLVINAGFVDIICNKAIYFSSTCGQRLCYN